MPALYLQCLTPLSYILQYVLHPPSPPQCSATLRVVADKIMLGYERNFLKTVDINAVVLVYSCLASSTQTAVGFAQFACCWCFCFCLHFSLNKHCFESISTFDTMQWYNNPFGLAIWTISIQEENPKEGTNLSYSYSAYLCSPKGTCQYKTRETVGIWIKDRKGRISSCVD